MTWLLRHIVLIEIAADIANLMGAVFLACDAFSRPKDLRRVAAMKKLSQALPSVKLENTEEVIASSSLQWARRGISFLLCGFFLQLCARLIEWLK